MRHVYALLCTGRRSLTLPCLPLFQVIAGCWFCLLVDLFCLLVDLGMESGELV